VANLWQKCLSQESVQPTTKAGLRLYDVSAVARNVARATDGSIRSRLLILFSDCRHPKEKTESFVEVCPILPYFPNFAVFSQLSWNFEESNE